MDWLNWAQIVLHGLVVQFDAFLRHHQHLFCCLGIFISAGALMLTGVLLCELLSQLVDLSHAGVLNELGGVDFGRRGQELDDLDVHFWLLVFLE